MPSLISMYSGFLWNIFYGNDGVLRQLYYSRGEDNVHGTPNYYRFAVSGG